MLCNELSGRGMRILNAFEDWWKRIGGTSSSATATSTRSTWSGCIFGERTMRPIDYTMADLTTSKRATSSFHDASRLCPSEHVPVGTSHDILQDIGVRRTRPAAKPIGWWPQRAEQYECEVLKGIEKSSPSTIADISDIIKAAASAAIVARARRRARAPGRSETEDSPSCPSDGIHNSGASPCGCNGIGLPQKGRRRPRPAS